MSDGASLCEVQIMGKINENISKGINLETNEINSIYLTAISEAAKVPYNEAVKIAEATGATVVYDDPLTAMTEEDKLTHGDSVICVYIARNPQKYDFEAVKKAKELLYKQYSRTAKYYGVYRSGILHSGVSANTVVSVEDVEQEAYLSMLDTILNKYDINSGITVSKYVEKRARFDILDKQKEGKLSVSDELKTAQNDKRIFRDIDKHPEDLKNKNYAAIAKRLNISEKKVRQVIKDTGGIKISCESLNGLQETFENESDTKHDGAAPRQKGGSDKDWQYSKANTAQDATNRVAMEGLMADLLSILDTEAGILTPQESYIVKHRGLMEETYKEIASDLFLSPNKVSEIYEEALGKIHEAYQNRGYIDMEVKVIFANM